MADNSTNKVTSQTPLAPVVFINPIAQLPLKLTSNNYPSWRAQVHSLLQGYNLLGYINGDIPQPTPIIIEDGLKISNPNYAIWVQQDQILLHAIFSSVSESLMPYIASSSSSRDAWEKLTQMYANRSRSHILLLKERLSLITRGDKSVTEFLQLVKSLADQLALVGSPLQEDDIILICLNGIGPEFKEISGAIRAREKPISFEALFDKLVEYEDFLKRSRGNNSHPNTTNNFQRHHYNQYKNGYYQKYPNLNYTQPNIFFPLNPNKPNKFNNLCQFCGKFNHTARECYTLKRLMGIPIFPKFNHSITNQRNAQSRLLLNRGASYRIISDMRKLSLHKPYEDSDDIIPGDGKGSYYGGTNNLRAEPE